MSDDFSYYETDGKCYESIYANTNDADDASLKEYLDTHFYSKKNIPIRENGPFEECKQFATENNKKYFLISDFDKSGLNTYTASCYIPKNSDNCDLSNVTSLERLFQPFNKVINDLFNSPASLTVMNPLEISGTPVDINSVYDKSENSDKNCYKYITDAATKPGDGLLAKKGNFYLYKMALIDREFNAEENTFQSYEHYKNIYETLFDNNNKHEQIFTNLKNKLNSYFCTTTNLSSANEKSLDNALKDLQDYYDLLFNNLDGISKDISNISLITKYDTLYLEELQKQINDEKRKLRNILGFDGANNGKLNDTKFMKQLKVSENIILMLVIFFVVFAYFKKKQ